MIDYKGIIEELSIEKIKNLLEKMDIPYREEEGYLLMPTVCHNENIEDASWKLYMYKNTKLFYCYTNCLGMSIFKFLENYYKTRGIEYNWYKDIYSVILDCSNYRDNLDSNSINRYKPIRQKYRINPMKELPVYDDIVLSSFVEMYPPEWLNDGISKEAMDKFNILFSISQNKIIIPHYNYKNELIGIRGRALDEWEIEFVGKYMPVEIEGNWYSHPLSLNLYGLNKTKDAIRENKYCFIFEAE